MRPNLHRWTLLGLLGVLEIVGVGGASARAQWVAVRRGPFHRRYTYVYRRPVAVPAPVVVTPTQYVYPATPVVQRQVIQPPPVVERRIVQPPPVVENRVIQPPPVVESRVVQPPPVVEQHVVQPPPIEERTVIQSPPIIEDRAVLQTSGFVPPPPPSPY